MWTRSELKTAAKEILKGNYWMCVIAAFIYGIVHGAANSGGGRGLGRSIGQLSSESSAEGISQADLNILMFIVMILFLIALVIMLVSLVLNVFVFMPLEVGCHRFFINCRDGSAIMDMIIFAFREGKDTYFNVVKIMFLMKLKIFLWTLLFIIPGIIKSYEYCMIPYIVAKDPNIDCDTAFEMSRNMTDGHKWNIFVLGLSFIGWILLCIPTLFLLHLFYVSPYIRLTMAELYHTLAAQNPYGGTYNDYNTIDELESAPL